MVCCPRGQSQKHLCSPQQQSVARGGPGPSAEGLLSQLPLSLLSSGQPLLCTPCLQFPYHFPVFTAQRSLCRVPDLESFASSVALIFRGLSYRTPFCSPCCGVVWRTVLDVCPCPYLPFRRGWSSGLRACRHVPQDSSGT